MCKRVMPWSFFAALAFASVALSHAQAEQYQNSFQHFKVDLPDGWQIMTPQELTGMNVMSQEYLRTKNIAKFEKFPPKDKLDKTKQDTPKSNPVPNVQWITGFRPKGGQVKDGAPYVLVEFLPFKLATLSHDEIEKHIFKAGLVLTKNPRVTQGTCLEIAKNTPLHSMTYDPNRRRAILRNQLAIPNGPIVEILSEANVSKEGIIFLHCYARSSIYEQTQPVFGEINDGFKFDTGYEYSSISRWNFGTTVAISSAVGACLGAVLGVAGFIFYHYLKRAG